MSDATSAEIHGARVAGMRAIPVIVNSKAGTAAAVLEALRATDAFELVECTGEEVAERTRELLARRPGRLAVAGGDGTVGTVAALVAATETELAIIPGGTLNHFARDHGIPTGLDEAIELARTGRARPADLAAVNGRIFLNTSSVGAYVSYVKVRDRLERRLGYRLGSLAAAVRVFFTMHRFTVEIEGSGGSRAFRTPLLFIGVGERELKLPTLGARVADGRAGLHVMVVKGRTRGAILALALGAALRGIRGIPTPHMEAAVLDRCSVTIHAHTRVAVDGELVALHSPLRYTHMPAALNLVRP